MASRSLSSGKSTYMILSKRPARINARSKISARLVAAITMTCSFVPKPSISVRSWFKVFSRSSLPPVKLFFPRARPMASISSIKMIHGDFSLACLNKSRTREAPTPTNISTKSEPESEKNGTLASPATAFANKVLPVPGGPESITPFGIRPPSSVYFFGFFKKSTISRTSSLAPVIPATSLKVVFTSVSLSKTLARDFPMLKICDPPPPPGAPPPPDMRRIMKSHTAIINTSGNTQEMMSPMKFS